MHLHHELTRTLVDERQRALRREAPPRRRSSWVPRRRRAGHPDRDGGIT
jgi:hypothetical protein